MNANIVVLINNVIRTLCVSAVTIFLCYHFNTWWFVVLMVLIAPSLVTRTRKEDKE